MSIWTAIVVTMVLISLLMLFFQKDDTLDAHVGAGVSEDSKINSEETYELNYYEDETYGYAIGIPNDWTRVTKDGYNTFVHSPSGTSLQIQTSDYSPQLLSVNEVSLKTQLENVGCKLLNFNWYDKTTYNVLYEKVVAGNKIIHAETTFFDRAHAIRLFYTVKEENVSRISRLINQMNNSFRWERKNPFPDGMTPYYSEYGNYEFVYPSDWTTGISNNTYIAQNTSNGAIISYSATASKATYETFSKLDYVNYASKGRSSFILRNYNADKNVVYAESTYMLNSTTMVLIQYLIANGNYEYAISFEVPYNVYESNKSIISEVINTFRIFDKGV